MVEVVHAGAGELVCCGQAMELCEENSTDAAREKHVPVVEVVDGKTRVLVGSVAHPMEAQHYIEWIELVGDSLALRHFLQPGEAPQASFPAAGSRVYARAYCNLHGLWQG